MIAAQFVEHDPFALAGYPIAVAIAAPSGPKSVHLIGDGEARAIISLMRQCFKEGTSTISLRSILE